jgi:uncharacterized membrane protein
VFSLLSLTNVTYSVGNGRALCGLVGGAAMILVGTVAPLTLNFTHHINRWERLVSIPGFLLGLTVIIAAWNGVSVAFTLSICFCTDILDRCV